MKRITITYDPAQAHESGPGALDLFSWLENELNAEGFKAAISETTADDKAQAIVAIEGGCVQWVIADRPCDVLVVDFDTMGTDEDDLYLIPKRDANDTDAHAYISDVCSQIDPARVAQILAATSGDDEE